MKILVLFAHPALQKSSINSHLIEGLDSMTGVTFHDLYETYPDYDIDVSQEQDLLIQNDCIIFHHPMYWYSQPAIMKEWMDLVLIHGWAYGSKGNALKDKLFFNALTTGGPRDAFNEDGLHGHTINEILVPVDLTAKRCKMINLPPFVVHGTYAMEKDELQAHKNKYKNLLETIVSDQLDLERALKLDYLNDYQ